MKLYHFTFWLQQTNMNPSSHYGTNIFVEEFKFQYVRERCPYSYCHLPHLPLNASFWQFLSKWHFALQCKYGIFPNILKTNTFQILTFMHWDSVGSFKQEICTIGYISQLSWNWRAHKRAGFFNGFELYVKLELFRNTYFRFKSWFCYSSHIGINVRGRNLHIFQRHTVKLKVKMWEIGFKVFVNVHEKITF